MQRCPFYLHGGQPVLKLPLSQYIHWLAYLLEVGVGDAPAKSEDEKRQGGYHPVESAVNMLLARVAFDALRNPEVKQKLVAHIHRKVNELRFPSYIHGIEVRAVVIVCRNS